MAINFGPFTFDQNTDERGQALLGTAIGLTPLALGFYGAARGFNGGLENVGKPFASGQPLRGLGTSIGVAAKTRGGNEAQRAAKLAEQFQAIISDSAAVDKFVQQLDGYNGVLQMLSAAVEDPHFGVDTTRVESFKNQVVQAMEEMSPDNMRQLITETMNTLVSDDAQTMLRLGRYVDEFRGIGKEIQVPNFDTMKSGVAYNPIEMGSITNRNLKGASAHTLDLANQVLQKFKSTGHKVEFYRYSEFGSGPDADAIQARILSPKGDRYVTNVSLRAERDLASGGRFMRTGADNNTLYATPRGALDASRLRGYYERGELTPGNVRKAYRSFEQMNVDMLDEFMKGGYFDATSYNARRQAFMGDVSRTGSAPGLQANPLGFGQHVRLQSARQMNHLAVVGIEGYGQEDLMKLGAQLSTLDGFDPGRAGNIISGHGAARTMHINLKANSPIARVEEALGITRRHMPVLARLEQMGGRRGSFYRPAGVSSNHAVGSTFLGPVGRTDAVLGDVVSGGANQFMVIDFNLAKSKMASVSGGGQAFTASRGHVLNPVDMVVLDPKSHGYGSSAILNKLMAAHGQGKGIWVDPADFGQYVGMTPAGKVKRLSPGESAKKMYLTVDRIVDAAGRRQIHIAGAQATESTMYKVFNMMHKGMVKTVGQREISALQRGNIEKDVARHLGARANEAIYTTPDIFGKGSGFLVNYLGRSALTVTQGLGDEASFLKTLKTSAQAMQDSDVIQALNLTKDKVVGDLYHHKYAISTVQAIAGKASARDIGMVLSGSYHTSYGSADQKEVQAGLESFVKRTLGGKEAEQAIAMMKRGYGVASSVSVRGPTVNEDWGAARVGMEKRTAMNMYEQLVIGGMSKDEASKIVGNVYKNKVGMKSHFELAKHLTRMTSSITGSESMLSDLTGTKINIDQFFDIMTSSKYAKFSDYLMSQEDGVRLDLSGADPKLLRAVKDQFGQTEIYLPGAAAIRAAGDAQMKTAGGQSMSVGGPLSQMMDSLAGRIMGAKGAELGEARESLGMWKRDAVDLYARVREGLVRGKLRGSVTGSTSVLDLTQGAGLSQQQFSFLKKAFAKTQGRLVTLNAAGFMSAMADQAGSKDLGFKLRTFFTGMEGKVGELSGLHSIGGRNPMLHAGNVFLQTVVRDVGEVSRFAKQDEWFMTHMRGTEVGRQLLGAHGAKDFTSFGDIKRKLSKDQQRSFFNDFASRIAEFSGMDTGNAVVGVPVVKSASGLDIGFAEGAYLDFDGDPMNMIFLNKRDSGLIGKLSNAQLMGNRTLIQEIGGQINTGIANIAKDNISGSATINPVVEDTLKEMGLNQVTGRVDLRLRSLHTALLDYGGDEQMTARSRALLASVQEKFILKTKKLPVYMPAAEMVSSAIDRLMTTGEIDSFEDVLKNYAFRGTDFATGAMLGGGSLQAASGNAEAFGVDMQRQGFTLQNLLDHMQSAARSAIANNETGTDSIGEWTRRLTGEHTAASAVRDIHAGQGMLNSAMGAYAGSSAETQAAKVGNAFQIVKTAMGNINMKMAGGIAGGLLGSVALMGMMGDEGYAAEPLTMPGEKIPSRVTDEIARGTLFTNARSDHKAAMRTAMQAPINMGTTYVEQPNAYQVRGETYSSAGLNHTAALIQRLTNGRGGGSIYVNDARRPITNSYVDRMMGVY